MLYFPRYGGGDAMPFVLLGAIILITALIIVPLFIFMFSNPLLFGGGLILLGLIWVITPKILYGLVYCIAKPYYFLVEKTAPKLRKTTWWQQLDRTNSNIAGIAMSEAFQRGVLYGLVLMTVILAIYFNYNPLVK